MSFSDVSNIIGFSIAVIGLSSIGVMLYTIFRAWTPYYAYKRLEEILKGICEHMELHLEDGYHYEDVTRLYKRLDSLRRKATELGIRVFEAHSHIQIAHKFLCGLSHEIRNAISEAESLMKDAKLLVLRREAAQWTPSTYFSANDEFPVRFEKSEAAVPSLTTSQPSSTLMEQSAESQPLMKPQQHYVSHYTPDHSSCAPPAKVTLPRINTSSPPKSSQTRFLRCFHMANTHV